MTYISKISKLLLGFILYLINPLFKVEKGLWLFGSSQGKAFTEGSKYMLMYVNNKSSQKSIWVTHSKEIKKKVNKQGFNCVLNTSFRALWYTLKAEVVFTSTSFGSDINYCFPKKNRKLVYLTHGMPQKKMIFDQPARRMANKTLPDRLYRKYVAAFSVLDIDCVTSTSDFFKPYLESAFRSKNVYNLGMPRNDALMRPELLKNEKYVPNIDGKFVITYMPTHRDYGKGEVPPFLFENNEEVNRYLEVNNIILLIKNHPNMAQRVVLGKDTSNIIDISKDGYDAQVVISQTDLLITDFSSVWIDFLLLKRPIVFYLYDDYEKNDNDTYFDIRTMGIGPICETENELFDVIKRIITNYSEFAIDNAIVNKYHTHVDDNSCKRLYDFLKK